MRLHLVSAAALLTCLYSAPAFAEVYVLRVEGLSCELCAYSVKRGLGRVPGVEDVRVNLDEGAVTVRTEDGTRLTEERAREVIEGSGFTLTGYRELTGSGSR